MTISGPVLLLAGDMDALFPPTGVMLQSARMGAGGAEVTTDIIPNAGHAITLGAAAPDAFTALDRWLTGHGF
jgi:pimeloyl-ACP methyl ester carboxylesterase